MSGGSRISHWRFLISSTLLEGVQITDVCGKFLSNLCVKLNYDTLEA